MKDKWERFFNWQSDMDWGWGPLMRFRPAKSERFKPEVFVFIYGTAAFAALAALCLFWAWPYFPALFNPHGMAGTTPLNLAAWLWGRLKSGSLHALLIAALAAWPYFWAWNRRADRLAKLPPDEIPTPLEGVWPPPPSIPG